ncbi:MAG: ABC transporter substrate-binding protein, partial [Spirochaetaceae bacterium]|nr:ABC transporter substrate-binding protein [Spirochaetaceae bacterium]
MNTKNNTKNSTKKIFFACIIFTLVLSACSKPKSGTASPAADTNGFAIKYAKLFSIDYMDGNIKLVTDQSGKKLLLVPYGQNVPSGFNEALVVRTPVKNAFYMYTTDVGFLDSLNSPDLLESVAAVSTPQNDWTIQKILDGFKSGRITYIPDNIVNVEPVIKINPDIIFAGTINMGAGDILGQFKATGLPYTVTADWMEESNFAFLEWIKFFAAFYNKDKEAAIIFEEKVKHINGLQDLTATIPPDQYPMVAYASVFNGIVYTQGGDSPTALEYKKAACTYYLANLHEKGQIRIGMEEFIDKAHDADILLYASLVNYTPDKQSFLETSPLLAELKAFKNDRVYVLSRSYYMDSARSDEKFNDLIAICHPELFPDRELSFYVK